MAEDYGKTLNLPSTEFSMRANLPQREPEILKKWQDENMYEKLMENNEGKPLFILHDGPPYANGNMHMGHALNKTLKDVITRFKNMDGFCAPYIHGWDTHGLPIERQAIKQLGVNRHEVGIVKFRDMCRDFALSQVENQKSQIQRLGSLGDWDNSYLTLAPEFEAKQVEIFGEMAKNGYIYKGLKPIYWCTDCETALAEAEIEYEEDKTSSIYVKFRVSEDNGVFDSSGVDKKDIYFVIWTTTTWTLPGNVAIALNPEFTYSLVKANGEYYVLAHELIENVLAANNISDYEVVAQYTGKELEMIRCQHPFIDRESLVIVGDHVTLDAGTGCVHTAPGHGAEDYVACRNYKEIPIIVPVDGKGYLNELAGEFAGLFYEESNAKIIEKLKEVNALYAIEDIIHQYPHCWRCKTPILFRATDQWFCSVDDFKDDAIKAIDEVEWIPGWGKDRITSMVRERKDWCISRQRKWGVPSPIFYCEVCGEPLIDKEAMLAVADLFGKEGSNAWFTHTAEEILPKGKKCSKCGCTSFTKEKEIMDVWFDSGSSHSAVLKNRPYLKWPADLYLEGADQYRGWFQSSLLTSVATMGTAPYKAVLTHGWVVDGKGRVMHKSLGNGIDPQEVIDQYGADVLRLWVVSADYRTDMRMSQDALKQLSEGYRKIRNTARYILSNVNDFDPNKDMVAYEDMLEIDKWAMLKLNQLIEKVIAAYEAYEFHTLYNATLNFCIVDMSNFYLDILKSRLYTEKADSKERRSAQSAMYLILNSIVKLLAPVLAYTCEEFLKFMPHLDGEEAESVMFSDMPEVSEKYNDSDLEEKWNKIIDIRADVNKALELARNEKTIGKSLDAEVTVYAKGENLELLKEIESELAEIFITSKAVAEDAEKADNAVAGDVVSVKVEASKFEKCGRCWVHSETVGTIEGFDGICADCVRKLTK